MLDRLIKEDVLQNVRCLLVGKPYDEIYYDEYREILFKISNRINLPIVYNLNFGHSLPRAMIPCGIRGKIDFANKHIFITENILD